MTLSGEDNEFLILLLLMKALANSCHSNCLLKYWQGLDGEATEPMIKELEEDREESQDPEIEFAIAGAVREYGGLEILLEMIKVCFSCSSHLPYVEFVN